MQLNKDKLVVNNLDLNVISFQHLNKSNFR